MNKWYRVILVLFALSCCGCATTITQYQMKDGEYAQGPFDTGNQKSIKSKIYSGTVFAVKAQAAPPGSGGNIGGLIFLIDLPLSFVADTILLPYARGGARFPAHGRSDAQKRARPDFADKRHS